MSWMILFQKQLFDLEVKCQGPTKVIMVHDLPPYDHASTHPRQSTRNIGSWRILNHFIRSNHSKCKFSMFLILHETRWNSNNYANQNGTRKNCFRYLKLMSLLNAAICTTINYTLWVEWYYFKNNYLTLRSNVKVPRRSLWYTTYLCLSR
jgi:hypothetical protein